MKSCMNSDLKKLRAINVLPKENGILHVPLHVIQFDRDQVPFWECSRKFREYPAFANCATAWLDDSITNME